MGIKLDKQVSVTGETGRAGDLPMVKALLRFPLTMEKTRRPLSPESSSEVGRAREMVAEFSLTWNWNSDSENCGELSLISLTAVRDRDRDL